MLSVWCVRIGTTRGLIQTYVHGVRDSIGFNVGCTDEVQPRLIWCTRVRISYTSKIGAREFVVPPHTIRYASISFSTCSSSSFSSSSSILLIKLVDFFHSHRPFLLHFYHYYYYFFPTLKIIKLVLDGLYCSVMHARTFIIIYNRIYMYVNVCAVFPFESYRV